MKVKTKDELRAEIAQLESSLSFALEKIRLVYFSHVQTFNAINTASRSMLTDDSDYEKAAFLMTVFYSELQRLTNSSLEDVIYVADCFLPSSGFDQCTIESIKKMIPEITKLGDMLFVDKKTVKEIIELRRLEREAG